MIYIEPNSEKWLSLDDLPKEQWKDIQDFESLYKISNYGRVKSLDRIKKSKRYYKNGLHYKTKILRQTISNDGYSKMQLYGDDGSFKTVRVHRLVAEAFIPNLYNKPQINHKDGNKQNNCVDNLEWCTNGENGKHAWDNNLRTKHFGSDNRSSRKVAQYTKNNELVKVWDCISDINKDLHYSRSSIINCCRNRQTTLHGYIWKYYEEVNNE